MSQAPYPSAPALAVFANAADVPAISEQLGKLQRKAHIQAGGIDEARQWCAAHGAPAILLIDLSEQNQPLPALQELLKQVGPTCRTIALSQLQDVDFFRQLLQLGVFDFLRKPLRLDLLAETLARADEDLPLGHAGTARAGRTVAVIGASGGLGCSTLVAALGQFLAHVRQTPTVVVDFDRVKSDLSLLLGMPADGGLAHLLQAPSIDPRLLQRTLQTAHEGPNKASPSRLQVLAQRPEADAPVSAERVLDLGAALGQLFSLSLWDLPAHRPSSATAVLSHAEVRIVLTEISVQGARHLQQLLREIGDESAGQSLLIIGSNVRQPALAGLSQAQFEAFIGRAVDVTLPAAGSALAASLLQGALNTHAAPAYAHAVAQLADHLLGRAPAQAPHTAPSLREKLKQWLGLTPVAQRV